MPALSPSLADEGPTVARSGMAGCATATPAVLLQRTRQAIRSMASAQPASPL